MPTQHRGIQALRALAVVIVVWFHANVFMLHGPAVELRDLRGFGVDIFFVISGFIMATIMLRPGQKPGRAAAFRFLSRRCIRIFPLYWIFALIHMFQLLHQRASIRPYLPSFLLLPSLSLPPLLFTGVGWTLHFEMIFYYVSGLVLLFTTRRAVPIVMSILLVAGSIGYLTDILHPVTIFVFNPILIEFVFGSLVAILYDRLGKSIRIGLPLFILGVIGTILIFVYQPDTYEMPVLHNQFLAVRVGVCGVIAMLLVGGVVLCVPALQSRIGRLIVAIGNASYSIYLSSMLTLNYGHRLLHNTVHLSEVYPPTRFLEQMVISLFAIGVGYLCYLFVETPLTHLLTPRRVTHVNMVKTEHLTPV